MNGDGSEDFQNVHLWSTKQVERTRREGQKGSDRMMAYLAMMAVRLIELHRVLSPTGSIWPRRKRKDTVLCGS